MKFLYSLSSISTLFILSLFISGCGGGNNVQSVALHQGSIKESITDNPLVNVEVTLQGQTTYTDENGSYKFSNLMPNNQETVTYKKNNYMISSKTIAIKTYSDDANLSLNFLESNMYKYDHIYKHATSSQVFNENNFNIEFPDEIYRDINNQKYSKEVSTSILYRNTTIQKNKNIFPGLYEGEDSNGVITPFISFGFISIHIEDQNQTQLHISDNITITFKTITGTTKETIPLWYYDHEKGFWVEDGYVTRTENGYYQGEISHTGTWSVSQPIEDAPGIFRGQILDEKGIPMTNIRLYAIGEHWIQSDLSTDDNGVFEIKVIPDQSFYLHAYNYHEKYGATFRRKIPGIASGEMSTK